MLRIPDSELGDPDCGFVAWSLRMRSSQFPNCTQKGAQQRETLPTLSKEDIQGVGKATDDGGTYRWHDLLAKTERMWSYRSCLKCLVSPFVTGERCSLPSPNSMQHADCDTAEDGEPWLRSPGTGLSVLVPSRLGCVTQSETLPLLESYFFIHEPRLD